MRFPAECLGGGTYAGSPPDCFSTDMSIIIAAVATTQQTPHRCTEISSPCTCPQCPARGKRRTKRTTTERVATLHLQENLESLSFKETENEPMFKSTKTQIATDDKRLDPKSYELHPVSVLSHYLAFCPTGYMLFFCDLESFIVDFITTRSIP